MLIYNKTRKSTYLAFNRFFYSCYLPVGSECKCEKKNSLF